MDIGMLWYDNDPKRTLAQKIEKAIAYHLEKYGKRPNTVFVNPAESGEVDIEGVNVRSYRSILPGHLWLGLEQAAGAVERRSEELVVQAEDIRRAVQTVMEL